MAALGQLLQINANSHYSDSFHHLLSPAGIDGRHPDLKKTLLENSFSEKAATMCYFCAFMANVSN